MREFNNDLQNDRLSSDNTGYAEWIALGAIAAGSIAAIVGMATCIRRRTVTVAEEAVDPSTITAPHGDKLKGAVG